MAQRGRRLARYLLGIVEHRRALDEYIAACQIGITFASLALGAFGQRAIAPALLPLAARLPGLDRLAAPAVLSLTAAAALIVLTFLSMVLGELFPKSVATKNPEQVALGVL